MVDTTITVKEFTKRINDAVSTIDAEQIRLSVLMNVLSKDIVTLDKNYILYNMMSSKMCLELVKSLLNNETPNYDFEDLTVKLETPEEKEYRKRIMKGDKNES